MNAELNIQIFSLRAGYMNEPLRRQRDEDSTVKLKQKKLYEYSGVVMAMLWYRPLRMRFFVVLMSVQRILDAGVDVELEMYRRAVRSVPGSGEVWARYIRLLVSS